VFLHTARIAASQNAQQLVVRNEEEAREGVALGVEVVVERLLAAFKTLRQSLQLRQPVWLMAGHLDVWLLESFSHYLHQPAPKQYN